MFRRLAFPIAVLLVLVAAALLAWLVASDVVPKDKCLDRGGAWDAGQRICTLGHPGPQSA